jgi:hypothetical protein
MSATNYLETQFLNELFLGPAEPKVLGNTNLYLGLLLAVSDLEQPFASEVSGLGYQRQLITDINNPLNNKFSRTSTNAIINTNDITFNPAQESWGQITHVGIYDSSTGGNCLFIGELEYPRPVANTDVVVFLAGDLSITME